MKSYLCLFIALSLILMPFPATAAPDMVKQADKVLVASGTVTGTNMKISAVDGTAFIDFGNATQLTGHLGQLLVVCDTAGKCIQAFPKSVGTGETLGDEIATGTLVILTLYKITATEVNHFGTDRIVGSYFTSAGTETCDANNKVKKVLTPATSGVSLTKTKGGTVYNYTSRQTGFNYADASYTYKFYRTPPTTVASGTSTLANTLLYLADNNSSAELVGVDLTAYHTGKHLLRVCSATDGKCSLGWISSVAPAGETLGGELLTTTWTNITGYLFDTLTNTGVDITSAITSSGARTYNDVTSSISGALYKASFTLTLNSGTAPTCSFVSQNQLFGNTPIAWSAVGTSAGANTLYGVSGGATVRYFGFRVGAASNFSTASTSLRRVNDPASTAARIVKSKSGSVRSWFYNGATANDAAGYTYAIYYYGD